jgi:hypothetical protein
LKVAFVSILLVKATFFIFNHRTRFEVSFKPPFCWNREKARRMLTGKLDNRKFVILSRVVIVYISTSYIITLL